MDEDAAIGLIIISVLFLVLASCVGALSHGKKESADISVPTQVEVQAVEIQDNKVRLIPDISSPTHREEHIKVDKDSVYIKKRLIIYEDETDEEIVVPSR